MKGQGAWGKWEALGGTEEPVRNRQRRPVSHLSSPLPSPGLARCLPGEVPTSVSTSCPASAGATQRQQLR